MKIYVLVFLLFTCRANHQNTPPGSIIPPGIVKIYLSGTGYKLTSGDHRKNYFNPLTARPFSKSRFFTAVNKFQL